MIAEGKKSMSNCKGKKKLKMKNATYKSASFTGSKMKDLLSH